jgi:spermidine synthase
MGHLGRHTGRMIAVSTIGSLVGTWGTAFFLLSWVGTRALVAWLGWIEAGLGLLWLWRALGSAAKPVGAFGALILSLGWLAHHPIEMLSAPVHQEDSPYQQVRVRDDELFRYLVLDRTFHAVMWKADPQTLFLPYSQLFVGALAYTPEPKRGLILGHGGGSLAKWLAMVWPQLELDIVELDPTVVRMAETYFDYQPPANHFVYVKDARAFLRTTPRTYDVIWVDVFARHLIPFHLTTAEFFAELRAHLNPEGVLAVNLASSGDDGDRMRAQAVVQTMSNSFPDIEWFSVKGPWKTPQPGAANLIFFAGRPIERTPIDAVIREVANLVAARRLPPDILALLSTRRDLPWPPGMTLTDDYAPYDLLVGSGRPEGRLQGM